MRSPNLSRICHSAKGENWLLIKERMSEPKETKRVSANGLNALMQRYSEVQLATLVTRHRRAMNGCMKLNSMAIDFWGL